MTDILFTPIRLNELEALIHNSVLKALNEIQFNQCNNQNEPDQLLTIKQAGELLKLSVATLYGYVHRAEIPVCKKQKRLYFSKQELTSWIKNGRKKTNAEISEQADTYIKNRKAK
jgi:hypothetical protein